MEQETKICTKCGEEKPLSEFYKNYRWKYNRYDIKPICKKCELISAHDRYVRNYDKYKETSRIYRENNREKILEYRKNNHDREIERGRLYRKNNPEKRKITCDKWRRENPNYNKEKYLKNRDKLKIKLKKYYEEHRDECYIRNREYIKKHRGENGKWRSDWQKNNHDKYIEMLRKSCTKSRNSLSDTYVKQTIVQSIDANKLGIKYSDLINHPELIEQKRTILKAKRLIKQFKTKENATS